MPKPESPLTRQSRYLTAPGLPRLELSQQRVRKRLLRTGRRCMNLAARFDQSKCIAKQFCHLLGISAYYAESAASFRAVLGESADNRMTPCGDCFAGDAHIGGGIRRIRKEVQGRAIVPYVDAIGWQLQLRHIGSDPPNIACRRPTKPIASHLQRGCRDVDCDNAPDALSYQFRNQRRCSSSHIHDSRAGLESGAGEQAQRYIEMRPEPTHFRRSLRGVYGVPM